MNKGIKEGRGGGTGAAHPEARGGARAVVGGWRGAWLLQWEEDTQAFPARCWLNAG